eukprot:2254543-Rhodomonas_salina.1
MVTCGICTLVTRPFDTWSRVLSTSSDMSSLRRAARPISLYSRVDATTSPPPISLRRQPSLCHTRSQISFSQSAFPSSSSLPLYLPILTVPTLLCSRRSIWPVSGYAQHSTVAPRILCTSSAPSGTGVASVLYRLVLTRYCVRCTSGRSSTRLRWLRAQPLSPASDRQRERDRQTGRTEIQTGTDRDRGQGKRGGGRRECGRSKERGERKGSERRGGREGENKEERARRGEREERGKRERERRRERERERRGESKTRVRRESERGERERGSEVVEAGAVEVGEAAGGERGEEEEERRQPQRVLLRQHCERGLRCLFAVKSRVS